MTNRDFIDDALAIGASFDIITPVASMIGNAITDRQHYGVPADQQIYVDMAAHDCGIRLRNRSVFGGQYQFDCTGDDMEAIRDWLGWG